MKKLKRFTISSGTAILSSMEMRQITGGVLEDGLWSICSCNDAIGTWHQYCAIDKLEKDIYDPAQCGGSSYYKCSAV